MSSIGKSDYLSSASPLANRAKTAVLSSPFVAESYDVVSVRAKELLKRNVDALLLRKGATRKDLAEWCKRSESWISQAFSKPNRGIPLKYYDRMADFFGVATYQLFQPGISIYTERRSGKDRRKGIERRVSHGERLEDAKHQPLQGQPRISVEDRDLLDRFYTLPTATLEAIKVLMSAHTVAQKDTETRRRKPTKVAR